jgi:hypothetical protein
MAVVEKRTALYFTTVAAYPGYRVALGGHFVKEGDDPKGTRLMLYTGTTWGHHDDIGVIIYDIAVRIPPGEAKRRLCVLGRQGFYREYVPSVGPVDIPIDPVEVGYLEDIAPIGDAVFACGAHGQVYRLRGARWEAIHRGIHVPFNGEDVERMLLSITGFAENDLYVCGFEGEVWHFNGKKWSELDSPTDLPLNAALCAPDKRVYFCGEGGNVFALEKDGSWLDLSNKQVSENALYDMTLFQGRVYIAADSKLLYIEADKLRAVADPNEGEWEFLKLDAADDRIWCVGSEEVFDYDGQKWTRHQCPENV